MVATSERTAPDGGLRQVGAASSSATILQAGRDNNVHSTVHLDVLVFVALSKNPLAVIKG
ncbi:hypothetical protein [Saccharothrix stipae]